MLGKIIGDNRWSWAAFGKHPSAQDYFQINLLHPIVPRPLPSGSKTDSGEFRKRSAETGFAHGDSGLVG
jgi:hypothetical protein